MKSPKLALCIALLSPVLLSPVYARGGGGGGGGHAGGGGGRSIGSVGGRSIGSVGGGFRGGASGGFRGAPYRYGGRYYGRPGVYLGFGYPYYGYGGYGYGGYGYGDYGYDDYGYDDYGSPYSYGYDPNAYPPYSVPPGGNYGYPYPPPSGYPVPPPQYQPPQYQLQPQSGAGADQTDDYYLLAFKDHTIEPATTYKVDGDQIHWVTREGRNRQAPVSTVDVELTQRLNGGRHIDSQIP
jgi:hypothetical protein